MRLRLDRVFRTGDDDLDVAVTALTVTALPDGFYLLAAAAGAGDQTVPGAPLPPGNGTGGLTAWRLGPDGALQLADTHHFTATQTAPPGGQMTVLPAGSGGGAALFVGAAAGGLRAHDLGPGGQIGTAWAPSATGTISAAGALAGDAAVNLLAASDAQTGAITLFRAEAGTLTALDTMPGDSAELAFAPAGGGLLSAAATADALRRLPLDGSATAVQLGAAEGLGVNAPTAVAAIAAHGHDFAVLAAAGTNSLSVLRLDPDGGLSTRDHVVDTRTTRFAGVQDVAAVESGGQVFVVAGGGDDGLSLLALLPDGRLVHLDRLANGPGGGLDGVARLTAAATPDAIRIFAATEGDTGVAALSVATPNLGMVLRGTGTLQGGAGDDLLFADGPATALIGGAGDDILAAGPGGSVLTGGAGADIFVLQAGGGTVRITDFEAGLDRLDLSDYTFLRGPGQLDITALASGARIAFGEESVTLETPGGTPLVPEELFGPAFDWPDRFHQPLSVPGPDDDTLPDPPSPDPPPPDPSQDADRLLAIRSDTPNPWLAGADITFTPETGSALTVATDAQGRFDLSMFAGQGGHLTIARPYSPGDPDIAVVDALNVLRLAVGLDPTFGRATPDDLIAADFNRDGDVGVFDALEVLKFSLNLSDTPPPEWLFLDAAADLAPVAAGAAPLPEGSALTIGADGLVQLDLIAILPGNIEGWP